MKKTLLYLIGGLAVICFIIFIVQEKSDEVIKEERETIITEDEADMRNNRKKLGKITSSTKKIIGLNHIETSISKKETNNGISIIYELYNAGDQDINLQFPSSQEYDYEIFNEAGDLIYRYSDEYVFAQVIRDVIFAKGKTLTFVAGLPKLEKGEYRISFWAAAKGLDTLKEEITIRVE
ncbi:BsuPI-related putative proteinase inhibitor [Fredinandcohnia salidurans]|uniref:Intracellular proteinase inhibitor BsuPI domain-containing protein n=1 Tax=Fredinandcohnia salidurans TaxID=2595041 RepID=A0ABW4MPW1_9BACI